MYDVGICEQHSFAFAQGLAISGQRPFLAHYSTFAQRGFDQLFQEVCLSHATSGSSSPSTVLAWSARTVKPTTGIYDIAWSRNCLPGLILMAPRDGVGLEAMLHWAHAPAQQPGPRRWLLSFAIPRMRCRLWTGV
jgi:1-deoxy-D-xylulose-5-phosphate synthase